MSKVDPAPAALLEALNDLANVLSACHDPQLVRDFLASLLTKSELLDVSARWELVHRIAEGQTQRQIARELGLSLCKITRGSKELKRVDSPFRKMLELRQQIQNK